ncbi:MAG TPA: leucyl aminopeptidase family protein [Acidiferrobacter sp.]|nr:leucyl aminopeptidase family protein [Acidiferrobacter sp.]
MTAFTAPRVRYLKTVPLKRVTTPYGHIAMMVRRLEDLSQAPFGDVLVRRAKARGITARPGAWFTTEAPNPAGTTLAVGFVDDAMAPFALLELGRKLTQFKKGTTKAALATPGLNGDAQRKSLHALISCMYARAPLPHFQEDRETEALTAIDVYGPNTDNASLRAGARGNHLARALSVLPGNYLNPGLYVKRIKELAAESGWRFRFLDEKRLGALGAGAFLAVTRAEAVGSGIVHLRYTPARATKRPIALVGKGICFDTGGVSLKPARHMYGMHEDMGGSAVALGTLLALTELKVPYIVDCYLAIAENTIGPRSYRPNDVVRAANGTTIEIVHTDAEGRMVLADTLSLACRTRPALVIDYATLTGACISALGTRMTGVFTNRPALFTRLIEAGHNSGERVWPFPLEDDYDVELKSDIADVKQCTLEGEADHILAALFLRRFLQHDPIWIHLDLSAARHKGGLGTIPTDTTGFGVQFSLALLLDSAWKW